MAELSPPIIFTRKKVSTGKAITFGSSILADAHGFGVAPTLSVVYLRCINAEGGFGVGDSVQMCGADLHDTSQGVQVKRNSTQTVIDVGAGGIVVANSGTKAVFAITAANWVFDIIDFL